jgi:hypothetical protein
VKKLLEHFTLKQAAEMCFDNGVMIDLIHVKSGQLKITLAA